MSRTEPVIPANPPAPVGSPTWWASRTRRPSGGRGRPPRSRQRIVAVALEIVDEVGVDAFSMRLLAERLGSGTATLYRHFGAKDELMAYVVDEIVGEVDAGDNVGGAEDWRRKIEHWADSFYEVLRSHPGASPLLVSQVPVGPKAMEKREAGLAALIAAGFPAVLAARTYTAIAHYVIGFTLQQHVRRAPSHEDSERLRDYYEGLDPKSYPATNASAAGLTTIALGDEFRFGLQIILDGVELERGRATGNCMGVPTSRRRRDR